MFLLQDLSPLSWHKLVNRLQTDKTFFNFFYKHYNSGSVKMPCDPNCRRWEVIAFKRQSQDKRNVISGDWSVAWWARGVTTPRRCAATSSCQTCQRWVRELSGSPSDDLIVRTLMTRMVGGGCLDDASYLINTMQWIYSHICTLSQCTQPEKRLRSNQIHTRYLFILSKVFEMSVLQWLDKMRSKTFLKYQAR